MDLLVPHLRVAERVLYSVPVYAFLLVGATIILVGNRAVAHLIVRYASLEADGHVSVISGRLPGE